MLNIYITELKKLSSRLIQVYPDHHGWDERGADGVRAWH